MKLEITVPAADFTEDFAKIMATLSNEQKIGIAKDVFNQILTTDLALERAAYAEEVIKRLRNDSYHRGENDTQITNGHKYRDEMLRFKPAKAVLIEELVKDSLKHSREVLAQIISDSPEIKAVMEETMATIKANAQETVNQLLTQMFFKGLQDMSSGAQYAMNTASNAQAQVAMLTQNLQSRGVL
jgi:hypothetical protein